MEQDDVAKFLLDHLPLRSMAVTDYMAVVDPDARWECDETIFVDGTWELIMWGWNRSLHEFMTSACAAITAHLRSEDYDCWIDKQGRAGRAHFRPCDE